MKVSKKIFSILLVVLTFQSCNIGTSGISKDDQIEKEIRDQIKVLNDRLFHALITDNPDQVRALFSDDLLEKQSKEEIDQLLKQLTSSFHAKKYRVLDEYYVSNLTSGTANRVTSDRFDDNDYKIEYKAINKEAYVSLLLPVGLDNDILLLVVYGRDGNVWKINIFQFGTYSILHKTAPEYYKLAKSNYNHSEMIDATNNIILAKQCLTPGGEIFSYQKEKEISDFYDKVLKEVNTQYPMPHTFEDIDTKPEVFLLTQQMLSDGVFPMVCYISKIDLKDTVALKSENDLLKTEVNQFFNGIDKNKKRVLYRAYNEMPEENTMVKHYGFVDEFTEW